MTPLASRLAGMLAFGLGAAGALGACGTTPYAGYCSTHYAQVQRANDRLALETDDVNSARTLRDRCACSTENRPLTAVGVCGGVSPRMGEIWACFTAQTQGQNARLVVDYDVDGLGDVVAGSVRVAPREQGADVPAPFADCVRQIFATTHYCINQLQSPTTHVTYALGFTAQEGS